MADCQWDSLATDFNSGLWTLPLCQIPFFQATIKRFVEERGGAPWKALDVGCGMGRYSIMSLEAGASYVLGFDVSKYMVEGAKRATDKFLQSQALPGSSRADFVVASATSCSSIPGAEEGTFDQAFCVYVLCNLDSKEEVKLALAEICKMLKPGGKLILCETHVLQCMLWDDKSIIPLLHKRGAPKEDGSKWGYFEDEGKPREMILRMNSEREIRFTNRFYTLSSWMSSILEAGFQITRFMESYVDPKAIPADAPDYAKFGAGKPLEMCWECTKPL